MRRLTAFILVLGLALPHHAWAMGRRPHTDPSQDSEPVVLTLRDCYDLALRRSETVAMQEQEFKRTGAQFLQAVGESVGDVNYVVTDSFQEKQRGAGGLDNSSVGGTLNSSERRERKFVINQPVFQGFKSIGALTGAGSLRKQKRGEVDRARDLLFLDVVQAFYGLLKFEKDLETIQGINALYDERIAELKDREKIGRSRVSEVVSSQAKRKVLEAELARAQGNLNIGREMMAFFTGVEASRIRLEDEDPAPGPGELPEILESVDSRPDVEAAKQAAKTAWRSVIVAQSEFWPQVDLKFDQYDHREGFQSGIDWDALFTIDVPLFTGGTTAGKFRESVIDWKKAKLSYSLTKRQAELEIKESYQNWSAFLAEHKALEEAAKAAQENFRLQKEDYSRNLVNNLDVLEALQSFFETSKEANRSYYDMKQSYWKLQTALGDSGERIL